MRPHTVLVAFVVNGSGMEDAQQRLMARLPNPEADCHEVIDCWWIAEDERYDGSDNDSAVFVPIGQKPAWSKRIWEPKS